MDFANNPSFIRQGPHPAVRLALCVLLSVALLIGDSRFGLMEHVREALSVALYPVQRAVNVPFAGARHAIDFFTTQAELKTENDELKNRHLLMSAQLRRLATVEREYRELRQLNELKSSRAEGGQLAEVLYTGRDPFSYKLIIDKGEDAHIRPGQPVIDSQGLIGQVTRVQPLTAEVTLIIDKNHMVPVMSERTGARAILYGYGGGVEVRYLPSHADVQEKDLLVTSGIDDLYPAGLPVARIGKVERNTGAAFARLSTSVVAGVQQSRFVLVLNQKQHVPARPAATDAQPRSTE